MSDLRERLLAVAEQTDMYALKEIHWSAYVEALWPSIEAELQKEQREIARWIRNCQVLIEETNAAHLETLSWKARAEQNYTEWEEANKLLEQTIEVLGEFPSYSIGVTWWRMRGYPFLDNLKALKKEPDVHQQAVAEMLAPKPIDHVDGGFKP